MRFLLIGMGFGIYIGIAENFRYRSLHTHINLVGWVTSGVYGLVYSLLPKVGSNRLSKIYFWLPVIGTPLMVISTFFAAVNKMEEGVMFGIPGAIIVLLAALVLAVNMFKNFPAATSQRKGSHQL